jgi:hypothetical protein
VGNCFAPHIATCMIGVGSGWYYFAVLRNRVGMRLGLGGDYALCMHAYLLAYLLARSLV